MSTADTALHWLSAGIVPIPCHRESKIAAIRWGRWQTHRPPKALVRRWFEDGDLNLGLLCGEISDGLTVLDFDARSAWLSWRREHKSLAESFQVKTARGRHLYLKVDDVPSRSFSRAGCDIKLSGYVVGAPSIHPSGHVYEVIDPEAPILEISRLDSALSGLSLAEYVECGHEAVGREVTAEHHRFAVAGSADALAASLQSHLHIRQETAGKLYPGIIGDIKQRLTILDVARQFTTMQPASPDNIWWMGRCPAPGHSDQHPSFSLSLQTGRAHCRKSDCSLHTSRGLDAIDLYAKLRNLTPRGAMAEMARSVGLLS